MQVEHVRQFKLIIFTLLVVSLSGCALYRTDGCELTFFKPAYMKRDRPVQKQDLQILAHATELVGDEQHWNRNDTRLCFYAEKWSLFCALAKASLEVTGEYKHRRVAMQEVRFTIDDNFPKRWKIHRLMEFNNNVATTFADIKWVLEQTMLRMEGRYQKQGLNEAKRL